uniref:Probable serine carboxypeptidase CPVL n=1 Tax=Cacopsylla melanoneura TaxID=428564 RepID=A0A8D8Y120_9HEMI
MFLFLVFLFLSLSSPSFSSPSPPLYITPLLQSGQYAQAQSLSHLTGFLPGEPVSSYSAFFTIAEGTHLHFWFHPVEKDENWQSKPVALWLQGGYGLSTIRGGIQEYLIAYNVTPDGLVGKYDSGLTQYMNVLMIDNTRVGFSHTQDPSYPIVGSYALIAGQYDGLLAYQGTIKSLRSLDWPGSDCLNTETFSRSQIWISGSLFGYIRRCPGLWEVLALRASHVVQLYQPAPLWKVVAAFVKETYKM